MCAVCSFKKSPLLSYSYIHTKHHWKMSPTKRIVFFFIYNNHSNLTSQYDLCFPFQMAVDLPSYRAICCPMPINAGFHNLLRWSLYSQKLFYRRFWKLYFSDVVLRRANRWKKISETEKLRIWKGCEYCWA